MRQVDGTIGAAGLEETARGYVFIMFILLQFSFRMRVFALSRSFEIQRGGLAPIADGCPASCSDKWNAA